MKAAKAAIVGLRVFIAEDDGLIGMQLEDELIDAGCEVVGYASNLRQAIDLALSIEADGALLDVNLGGELVYEAAAILLARGIPFYFLTGYGPESIDPAFRDQRVLQKPFDCSKAAQLLAAWRRG